MSPLETNLAALGRRFPELAALVEAAAESPFVVVPAASGEPSARSSGGSWLHSSRDPRAEARRIAAATGQGGEDRAVLLGFGLGYVAEALALGGRGAGEDGLPGTLLGPGPDFGGIIVCESSPGALRSAFAARDLSALLADERLGFVVGGEPEGLISALELSGGTRAALVELRAATASDPAWFARARRAAERWNAKGSVNQNTLRRFGRLWVRNLARNLGAAASSPGVDRLVGLFAGGAGASVTPIPALVLAAGPSLDLILPQVRELARRAVLICVDTALRSLLRYGLEPDFLVVVDPQYWNWRHVAGLSSPTSFLVSEAAAWPALFRATRRGTFMGGSLFPLGRRIEAFAGAKGQLGAGGSVATSAWDLARIMGCEPIWMAGLDLGFPGGQTHAKASLFEQRALASACRLDTAANSQAAALVGGQSMEAASAEGGRLRTDSRMSLYAWWFESRLTRPGSPPTNSLSPGGLGIPGLRLGRVEELLSCPLRRVAIDEVLAQVEAMGREPTPGRAEKLSTGLQSLRSQLESVARIAEGARVAAREGGRSLASGGSFRDCLSLLERADRELLALEARDVAGFLLPGLEELLGRRARDLVESLAQSEALYEGLAESARYHLRVLAERY